LIVIQAIRAHLAELPLGGGWLRALADGRLATALALIHQHPEAPWTVARLAVARVLVRQRGRPPNRRVPGWSGALNRRADLEAPGGDADPLHVAGLAAAFGWSALCSHRR
jgi:hypothetical protein